MIDVENKIKLESLSKNAEIRYSNLKTQKTFKTLKSLSEFKNFTRSTIERLKT